MAGWLLLLFFSRAEEEEQQQQRGSVTITALSGRGTRKRHEKVIASESLVDTSLKFIYDDCQVHWRNPFFLLLPSVISSLNGPFFGACIDTLEAARKTTLLTFSKRKETLRLAKPHVSPRRVVDPLIVPRIFRRCGFFTNSKSIAIEPLSTGPGPVFLSTHDAQLNFSEEIRSVRCNGHQSNQTGRMACSTAYGT